MLAQKKLTPEEIWAKNNPAAAANKAKQAVDKLRATTASKEAVQQFLDTPGITERLQANGFTIGTEPARGRISRAPAAGTKIYIQSANGESIPLDANMAYAFALTPQEIAQLPPDTARGVAFNLMTMGSSSGANPANQLFSTFQQQQPAQTHQATLEQILQSDSSSWNNVRDQFEGNLANVSAGIGAFAGAPFGLPGQIIGAAVGQLAANELTSEGAQQYINPDAQRASAMIGGFGGAAFNAPAIAGGAVQPSYFGAEPVPPGTTDYLNAGNGLADTGITGGGLTGVPGAGGTPFSMPLAGVPGYTAPISGDFSMPLTDTPGYTPSGNDLLNAGAGGAAISGGGTADPTLGQVLGAVAPSVLGYVGSQDIADQQAQLAREYMALGAPSRSRYEASYAPDFTMANDPGYTDALNQTSKSVLHGLSAQGNPADSPNAWAQSLSDIYQQTAYPALQNYRTTNATSGGLASAFPAGVDANNANLESQGDMWNAIGAGASAVNNIFNPTPQSAWDKYLASVTK